MTILKAPTRRDTHRQQLAQLLDRDPATLPDTALLRQELGLDSLALMTVLSWLDTRGVTIDTDQNQPATVGDVLSLLDKAASPGLSIRIVDGPDIEPTDVADATLSRTSIDPLVPAMTGRGFRLTPIEPDDVGFLYRLSVQPETAFRWRYRGAQPSPERFAADLFTQVLVQYTARRTRDNQPVGLVVAYGANASMRHAYVGAAFQPQYAGTGLAAGTVALFVRYLFHTYPMSKLYLEIPGFNWPQMCSGEGRLFQVEGILRDHHYYAGRLWDQYLCAIYPDRPPGRP